MRAVVCQNAELSVVDVADPVPVPGQLLIEVLRCGICGSDLHARYHCDQWADIMAQSGYQRFARSHEQVIYGHEFCGEVLEHGPGCKMTHRVGTAAQLH